MNCEQFLKQALSLGLFFLCFGQIDAIAFAQKAQFENKIDSFQIAWQPKVSRIVLHLLEDTWVSSFEGERDGGNGSARRLKVKGQQEYSLLKFDHSPLKGKILAGAILHIRSASTRKAPVARLGVSTVAGRWKEGTAKRYRSQEGSACFNKAGYGQRPWTYPDSTLMDAVFGRGHTLWKFSECSPPNTDGWQTCAVDPRVVAANVGGLSHGLCLFDEVGSEWSCRNGKFSCKVFPNRFVHSRESKNGAPWLEIWTDGTDSIPPKAVTDVRVDTTELPAGEAIITWRTPVDQGKGKTLGFQVSYQKERREVSFPRYLIPMARTHGEMVRMHIKDMPFKSGERLVVAIRPVDGAGNVGRAFRTGVRLSTGAGMPAMLPLGTTAADAHPPMMRVGNLKIAVMDPLTTFDPMDEAVSLSEKPPGEIHNSGPPAGKSKIDLYSAKNETVAFQLVMNGRAENIRVAYDYEGHPELKPRLYQFGYVKNGKKKGRSKTILPDPLLPLKTVSSIPSTAGRVAIPNQKSHALICELYIPHDEPAGKKKGNLSITVGNHRLKIDVNLTVWNFTLPNRLSFIPEMNAYGTVSPYKDYEYYRLAHEHRTCINRLPYGWSGRPAFAPAWNGRSFNWLKWDRKVGPLFDGSAFMDLPRKGEPVDVFYLPLNENWPVNIFDHYHPSYWADEAFTERYPKVLKKAYADFARHCDNKKWHDTIFQFYLNNKVYYRQKYRLSSAPWIFDEPVNTQDFWALRWYGIMWKEAVAKAMGDARMWFRGDISYSQFGRNMLWGIMDVEYIGGNTAQKTRMKHDEWTLHGKSYFAEYGSANKIGDSNLQPLLWCLSAWSKGAMGVLPWQTIGSKNCWQQAEQTALFYPHPDGPFPSIRIKAFTQGQQFVEYLTLFCKTFNVPRYVAARWLKEKLHLDEKVNKKAASDAGTIGFSDVTLADIRKIKMVLGKMLDKVAPPYRRALVDWKTPEWKPDQLPDIGYVRPAPKVKSAKPDCDDFRPM